MTFPGVPAEESPPDPARGVRVVIDARPLQDPERAPLTAIYVGELLAALDADPVEGESFSLLLAAGRDDPTEAFTRLPVIGRRHLPPTRLLRSGALTADPLLLRGASVGAGWRAERDGAAGSVYHAAGGGLPILSGIPVVAALLDLAPWAMPQEYQRGTAARFGQRLRARIMRDAAAVLVPGRAAATEARRLLHVKRDRIRVVPLAPRPAFRPEALGAGLAERTRLGLGARYAVYTGRFDARQDLPTLLEALARLAASPVPDGVPAGAWPPRVCLVGASPDDRAALSAGRAPWRRGRPARVRAGPPRRAAGRAGRRGTDGAPAGTRRDRGHLRAGGARHGRAGRRERGGHAARDRRPGRASSWSRATRPDSPRGSPRRGPTTTRTRGSWPPPANARSGTAPGRTWPARPAPSGPRWPAGRRSSSAPRQIGPDETRR